MTEASSPASSVGGHASSSGKRASILRFLRDWWLAIVAVGFVVGLYLAALPLKLEWVVAAVVVVGLGVVVVERAYHRGRQLLSRAREHPHLTRQLDEARAAIAAAREAESAARADVETTRARHTVEIAQAREAAARLAVSAMMGREARVPPVIEAVAPTTTGGIQLIAKPGHGSGAVSIGARFQLTFAETGDYKGDAVVIGIAADGRLTLRAVDLEDEVFWDALRFGAMTDPGAARRLQVVIYQPSLEPREETS